MSVTSYLKSRLPEDDLRQMQLDRLKGFESQDLEDGHYDVTFEIEGKKLHAHRFTIAAVSETMKVMLSDRWSNKDESVKIESYSYDDFYQFLCFLYSGECYVSNENVFQLVDLAEFYAVPSLKELCDKFLSKMDSLCTSENVEEMHEFAQKYTMTKMESVVHTFISYKFRAIVQAEGFLSFKKPFIKHLLTFFKNDDEKLFEVVYKWSEHQIMKQQPTDDESFNLQRAIKAEVKTILPHPDFSSMSFQFLMDFVLEKGYELSKIDFYNLKIEYDSYSEKNVFKSLFKLAEKQALQKQKTTSPEDDFNVSAYIRAHLAEIKHNFGFYHLDEQFLMDSVVANGIITEEQAKHVYDTRVRITNNGKRIYGVFKDKICLRQAYGGRKASFNVKRCSTTKIRFPQKRFTIPKTPSTITKMKGVDWYLCLEDDGVLSFKSYAEVGSSDYLLAEMKSTTEFELTRNEKTILSAKYNNLNFVR